MKNDRDKILQILADKPLKLFAIMQRVNIRNEQECHQLLLKMRDEMLVKFDIKSGFWAKI
jgi:hypothetical protein